MNIWTKRLTDQQTDGTVRRKTDGDRQTCEHKHRKRNDKHIATEIDNQIDRQVDIQTLRLTKIQTDRQSVG